MAVKTTRVRVCDICGREGTQPYRVGLPAPARLSMFDLCPEHAAPLEAFRGLRRPHPGRMPEARQVSTVAEVSRKRTRKKPAKRAG